DYLIGNFTIHCNTTTCCKTDLIFKPGIENTNLFNLSGDQPFATDNGTFKCGTPRIEVNKTVYDPVAGAWVDSIEDAEIGDEYRFRIEVHGICCNYTNLVIDDTLSPSLEYNNSATPYEGVLVDTLPDGSKVYRWTFPALNKCETRIIEFNVTVVDYGYNCNVANATAWCEEEGKEFSGEDDACVSVPPPARIEVEKTVWNGTAWVKVIPDAKISDIYRFNCTIRNSGSYDLTDIRFWDILNSSLEYAGNATLKTPDGITRNIELTDSFIFKQKYLHGPENLDIFNPLNTSWHELYPEYCNWYNLSSWEDNGDGYLSESDQIDMTDEYGNVAWYHVDRVMFTLWVKNETTGDELYLDSEADYDPAGLTDPSGAWHEIYPVFSKEWIIDDWDDTDGDGLVDYCDYVHMVNLHDCGKTGWYHVLGVSPDIVVSREWIIDEWLQAPLTLKPGQSVEIQFDAHVVNYGNDSNTQCAKGWDEVGMQWVRSCDMAWINTPEPDLIVSDVTVNYDANSIVDTPVGPVPHDGALTQCNNISANITELNGVDVKFPFNVKFEVFNESGLIASRTVPVSPMPGGNTTTVYCDCLFFPYAGKTYTINVTADSTNNIIESNESNNMMQWGPKEATWYGGKGHHYQDGREVWPVQCLNGTINLVYSVGDSKTLSSWYNPDWTTYTANWTTSDLPIPPEETCIKMARLYVYYDWDKTPGRNASDYFSMEFNGIPVPKVANYSDGYLAGKYPYGVVVYDVTAAFKATSNNTAVLTNSYPGGGKVSMDGMLLVVVYNHPDEPERIIWINEGCDNLKASTTGARYNYNVNAEEATAYAPFEGCEPIPMDEIGRATLITITDWPAGWDEPFNRLYFNGELVADRAWSTTMGASPLGDNVADVTALLNETNNYANFQSYIPEGEVEGDGFVATNAFLIVEKSPKEIIVDAPEMVQAQDQFEVDIVVDPHGYDIYGVQYELHYNTSVLRAEAQNKGPLLGPTGSTLVIRNEIHHAEGYTEYAEVMT
ncbi:MAG: hypothetical protein DRO11_07810, partial [Methanobacteriota archaeon]